MQTREIEIRSINHLGVREGSNRRSRVNMTASKRGRLVDTLFRDNFEYFGD